MNYRDLANKYEEQIKVLTQMVETLNQTILSLTQEIKESNASYKATIQSLKADLDAKNKLLEKEGLANKKLASKLNGLEKTFLPKETEKQKPKVRKTKEEIKSAIKKRGNNGSKRKVLDIEEQITIVDPLDANFNMDDARLIAHRDVVRYEFIPSKLIKHIYRCKRYTVKGDIYEGKAPSTPLLNSQYSSSFIAFLIQQRYILGLPIERIIGYLHETGVDIPKSTVHSLLSRTADMLDRLEPVLKRAIFESPYVHMDETYHKVIDSSTEKGSRNAYIWAAMAHDSNLIQYHYNEGSRHKATFMDYFPKDYYGTIQTDGYITYKVLEGMDYPGTVRIGCIQHCKRYFNDIKTQPQARRIISLYNKFYQIRDKKKREDWVRLSLDVYNELHDYLRKLDKDPRYIGNEVLCKGVTYCLNEIHSIENIIRSTEYRLDNNDIERPMRYISISRRNSMVFGSDKGAERSALIYSLAISCRLNRVNSYEYFNDMIMRLAEASSTADYNELRELLPDKWTKQK